MFMKDRRTSSSTALVAVPGAVCNNAVLQAGFDPASLDQDSSALLTYKVERDSAGVPSLVVMGRQCGKTRSCISQLLSEIQEEARISRITQERYDALEAMSTEEKVELMPTLSGADLRVVAALLRGQIPDVKITPDYRFVDYPLRIL